MTLPNIIGLSGYAQAGKNTVGDALAELGYKQLAFADTLKSMALVLDPYVVYFTNEGIVPEVTPEPVRLHWLVDELGWEGAKQNPEVRRFLQVLGTEAVRDHLGEDTWVNALFRKVGAERVVVTDCRFPNEVMAVKEWGGEVWRVDRPNFDNGLGIDHPSEAHIATLPVDRVLVNDRSVEDLHRLVREIAQFAEFH